MATTISIFCGFWHCHPYIPQHFLKMFLLLVCTLFPCNSTVTEDVVILVEQVHRFEFACTICNLTLLHLRSVNWHNLDHRTTWQTSTRLCGNAFTLGVYVCRAVQARFNFLFYVHAGLHHHMWLHNFKELLTALFKTILCILLIEVQAIAGLIYESKLPLFWKRGTVGDKSPNDMCVDGNEVYRKIETLGTEIRAIPKINKNGQV